MRIAGITWTFSPVADCAVATLQGRSQEGGGVESPKLMGDIAATMVEGYQAGGRVAACVKHVGPYQYTHGPDYTVEPIGKRAFLEDCWPRYAAGLAAGALTAMMSFVDLDGEPSHASEYLAALLRRTAVPGVVVISDFTGINELVEFGVAGDPREAALLAFRRGGVHIDLSGGVYGAWLPGLVEDGSIPAADIMMRAADVVQLKKNLGLFDDPLYCGIPARRHELFESVPEFVRLAEESIVLLRPKQPDPSILPIPGNARLLVAGPLADSKIDWLGEWCSNARSHLDRVVTAYAGLKAEWPSAVLAPGVGFEEHLPDPERLRALDLANAASHIVVCLGERENWSGESKARLMPKIPAPQADLVRDLRKAHAQARIIVLLTAGRQLKVPNVVQECADAILWVPQLGTFAGTAVANVLSGRADPSGRLAYSLPRDEHLTSGFSHRERRLGRPLFPTSPASPGHREPRWKAYFQELGEDAPYAEFWFGEGYSYTTFELSERSASSAVLSSGGKPLVARVTVANTGARAGKETVQLYWHDTVSEAVPRRLELLDYQQIELEPGEKKVLAFTVTPAMLAQYGRDLAEGMRPRPDPHPNYLFLVRHAGEAEAALADLAGRDALLTFTLVD
jgi:beta-glucosidase